MSKISAIVPFVLEPLLPATVQAIHMELTGLDHEIITIDNFCPEVEKQSQYSDSVLCQCCMNPMDINVVDVLKNDYIEKKAESKDWLKYVTYKEKLSHWNSKNVGVRASDGDILVFLDAHCLFEPGALRLAVEYYQKFGDSLHGTLHLPIIYFLDQSKLTYRLMLQPEKGLYHYTFNSYQNGATPYQVSCMSTCGMIIDRKIFDALGGWPHGLGIYGGGENFINFSLAIMGYQKWISPYGGLYHYAHTRGYRYNYDDFVRNRMISTNIAIGPDAAMRFANNCHGDKTILKYLLNEALEWSQDHRRLIQSQKTMDIQEWLEKMKKENMWDGVCVNKEYVD